MKDSLSKCFEKLKKDSMDRFGTNPSSPYFEGCNLFISNQDEEGYAKWLPVEIEQIDLENREKLNNELIDFYTSYYYLNLEGEYDGIDFIFENNMYSNEEINKKVSGAIKNGKYYFEDGNSVLLGNASYEDNDNLLFFYDIKNESVFIYDQDLKKVFDKRYKLVDIIGNMTPII